MQVVDHLQYGVIYYNYQNALPTFFCNVIGANCTENLNKNENAQRTFGFIVK